MSVLLSLFSLDNAKLSVVDNHEIEKENSFEIPDDQILHREPCWASIVRVSLDQTLATLEHYN